jgi:DNA-directed RNA polymerase sigma subunit (sigma70/sigma32)
MRNKRSERCRQFRKNSFHFITVPGNLKCSTRLLSVREYDILCRSAGVEYDKVQSLSEIGRAYGISKERVRQIRENAVLKMKRLLSNVA